MVDRSPGIAAPRGGAIQGVAGESFEAGRMGTYTIQEDPTRPGTGALRVVMGPFSVYNKDNPGV